MQILAKCGCGNVAIFNPTKSMRDVRTFLGSEIDRLKRLPCPNCRATLADSDFLISELNENGNRAVPLPKDFFD